MILNKAELAQALAMLRSAFSEDEADREIPLSATALYNIVRMQARRLHGEQIIFHPSTVSENRTLKVDEYPIILSLAIVLQVMSKLKKSDRAHVYFREEKDSLCFTILISPSDSALLRRELRKIQTTLRKIALSSSLVSELHMKGDCFTYLLSARAGELELSKLHANDELLEALVTLAFQEAREIIH